MALEVALTCHPVSTLYRQSIQLLFRAILSQQRSHRIQICSAYTPYLISSGIVQFPEFAHNARYIHFGIEPTHPTQVLSIEVSQLSSHVMTCFVLRASPTGVWNITMHFRFQSVTNPIVGVFRWSSRGTIQQRPISIICYV